MISSASGCMSRSSSDMRSWATSQPVRCMATANADMLSLASACAARIRGAHSSQASMYSRRSPSSWREEYDKALDALSKEWATFGDRLVDRCYPFHLVWLSMLMFVFEVLVHQKGKDSAWQDIKQLADDYFGGLSPEEEALIRRGNDPANKIH